MRFLILKLFLLRNEKLFGDAIVIADYMIYLILKTKLKRENIYRTQ